jgi:hypothetical protein
MLKTSPSDFNHDEGLRTKLQRWYDLLYEFAPDLMEKERSKNPKRFEELEKMVLRRKGELLIPESSGETFYRRIRPNKTGAGGHSFEIRIPRPIVELVGIDESTDLLVKLDRQGRIILEKAESPLREFSKAKRGTKD